MRRIAVVVLAASLSPLTLAVPAYAQQNAAKTDFVATNVTPPTVSAVAPDRTAAGTLVTTDAGGTSHPLAGAPVRLSVLNEIDHGTTDLGGAVTDSQGHFSKGFRFLAPGIVFVRYAGDAQHRSASYSREILTMKVTTAITAVAAPQPKIAGDTVAVSGLAQWVAGSNDLRPLADQPVRVTNLADHKVVTVRTSTDGSYRLAVKVYGYARWTASVGGANTVEDAPYYGATATTDPVIAAYPTRVSGFNAAPEPVRKGHTITVSGYLQHQPWKAYAKQTVKIYFEAKGAKKWTYEGKATTDKKGRFTHGFKAAKDGTWRAVFAGNATYLPVTGSGDYVDVR